MLLEIVTGTLAVLILAMTVHGGILAAEGKQRKIWVAYGVVGSILVIWQAVLLHYDSKHKDDEFGQLKNQITMLVNASKTQATIDDIRAIGSAISTGLHDVETILKACFKSSPKGAVPIQSVLPPAPPPIEHIQITERRTTSDIQGVPYGWQVIMQANDTISPVAFRIECDAAIEQGNVFIAGQAVYMQKADQYSQDRKSYSFSFHYPPLTPMAPLVVTVFSKQDIHITKIEKIQPLF